MTNFLYNPDRKGKQQLIEEFVVRTNILDEIMQDIETSNMKTPEQHYLLVGQRGTGKTTLLHRIKYAIEDSTNLNSWLIPVIFNEEQYNISELANLWENICQILEDYHGFENLYGKVEQYADSVDFEEISYGILEEHLKEHKKKLVVLIDNVGDLLQKLDDQEIRRFRELLQTKPYLRFIVASPFFLDSVLDYTQPFFEFFKVMKLEGLNKEQTEKLLLKLGEVYHEKEKILHILKETPERIDTLRVLTGGVPRTIGLMFRIFVDYEHESSVKDMERILDAVTPLYKHRMDDLPKQQQKIVDAVAKNWDAISVKELKDKIRLDSKTISAQLNQLEKNQIIEKRIGKTKNHLYLIKERFWNIWYLMRYGRKFDKERVIWLVRFMECWYSRNELESRVLDFIKRMKNKELTESTIELFGIAYTSLKSIPIKLRMYLHDSLPSPMASAIELDEEIMEVALRHYKNGDFKGMLDLISRISRFDDSNKQLLIILMLDIPLDVLASYIKDEASNEDPFALGTLFVFFAAMAIFILSFSLDTMNFYEKSDYVSLKEIYSYLKMILKVRGYDASVEIMLLSGVFKSLLITNNTSIAIEFFKGEDAEYLKKKFDVVYTIIDYYHQNQNEAILFPLPEEKKQIILEEIQNINQKRNTFKFLIKK